MDDDRKDLIQQLLATAMAMLEDATEVASAGQAHAVLPDELVCLARRLRATALDIAALAEAARVLAAPAMTATETNVQDIS